MNSDQRLEELKNFRSNHIKKFELSIKELERERKQLLAIARYKRMEIKLLKDGVAIPRAFRSAVEYRAFKSAGYEINDEMFPIRIDENSDKINRLRARIWKMINYLGS